MYFYASTLNRLWEQIQRASWTSLSLWFGTALLAISILVLMLTSWGRSNPLRKCIFLSLLAHLLVGLYFMSIRMAYYHPGKSLGEGIHATLWDEGPVPWEPFPPPEQSPDSKPLVNANAVENKDPANDKNDSPAAEPVKSNEPLLLAAPNDSLLKEATQPPPVAAIPPSTPEVGPELTISETPVTEPIKVPVAAASIPTTEAPATQNATFQPNRVPDIYRDRTAANRRELVLSRGGSPESEDAVERALKWLALAQARDGSWNAARFGAGQERYVLGHDRSGAGAKADTAMTGLALLTFMGAGHTHMQQKEYSTVVQRGLEYLISIQARDGNLSGGAELFAAMYAHGMASLAISEAMALTGDTRLEPYVRRALDYSIRAQHLASGSWRYQPNESGDMSQLGWQLMALKSGEVAGIPVPAATHDGMIRFIKSASSGTQGGLAGYRPHERPSRTMTAEALVSRLFLGMSRDNPAASEAAEYLLGELPDEKRINLYYWYYGTLALYQLGGEPWEKWNAALQKTLLPRQISQGNMAGSWNPDCVWGGYGGRVYSTAMATLCLEVYYRYLPLYQHEQRIANRPETGVLPR
jgi:hypothetical protein